MRRAILSAAFLALVCAGCHRVDARSGDRLEVAVFEGGYGINWHRSVAREYERLHPGIHVYLWGDPRVDEKIKPRILRGDPPDLASCTLPAWKLIVAGKLYPLDAALESPAYGSKSTWRDTLTPGVLADYRYEGKTYAMPTNLGAWVCWYDRRMFRQHGWAPPKTWDQFLRLCDRIKAAGIAPLAFQGKYPTYAWPTLLTLYLRMAPYSRFVDLQNLARRAFLDPAFVRAAGLVQSMALRYFEPGAMAMTHTESQLEFVNGRAAMVFCGLWLHHEMKDAIPAGFEMDCFAVPDVTGGVGDARAVYGGGAEDFFVFKDAPHPRLALDFLKFMVSRRAARTYVEQLDSLSPVQGCTNGVAISQDLRTAVGIIDHSDRIVDDRLGTLYLTFGTVTEPDALAALLEDRITPQQFAARLQAAADAIRADPDIYKPPPIAAGP